MRFTDADVVSGNRATDAPVHPNFRTVSLVLACPLIYTSPYPCQQLFLFAPTSPFNEDGGYVVLNAGLLRLWSRRYDWGGG